MKGHLLVLVLIGCVAVNVRAYAEPSGERDADMAVYVLMGERFEIPTAYLSSIDKGSRGRTETGHGHMVFMEVEPETMRPAVAAPRTPQGWQKAIRENVDIYLRTTDISGFVQRQYAVPVLRRRCQELSPMLSKCPEWSGVWKHEKEALVFKRPDGTERVFECDIPRSGLNAYCEIALPMVDHIDLYIRFVRQFLDARDGIVDRALALVCAFFKPDPARTYTVNHCK